jgi:hypothetical protein
MLIANSIDLIQKAKMYATAQVESLANPSMETFRGKGQAPGKGNPQTRGREPGEGHQPGSGGPRIR